MYSGLKADRYEFDGQPVPGTPPDAAAVGRLVARQFSFLPKSVSSTVEEAGREAVTGNDLDVGKAFVHADE